MRKLVLRSSYNKFWVQLNIKWSLMYIQKWLSAIFLRTLTCINYRPAVLEIRHKYKKIQNTWSYICLLLSLAHYTTLGIVNDWLAWLYRSIISRGLIKDNLISFVVIVAVHRKNCEFFSTRELKATPALWQLKHYTLHVD